MSIEVCTSTAYAPLSLQSTSLSRRAPIERRAEHQADPPSRSRTDEPPAMLFPPLPRSSSPLSIQRLQLPLHHLRHRARSASCRLVARIHLPAAGVQRADGCCAFRLVVVVLLNAGLDRAGCESVQYCSCTYPLPGNLGPMTSRSVLDECGDGRMEVNNISIGLDVIGLEAPSFQK
jgi:hypothetical protein